MSMISGMSSKDIGQQYLQLLLTQLQNQNPLEPMDNDQMASQLASLSQLEQIEGISQKFDQVLESVQLNEAASLLGRSVTFTPTEGGMPTQQTVDSVEFDEGELLLRAGTHVLSPAQITAIE